MNATVLRPMPPSEEGDTKGEASDTIRAIIKETPGARRPTKRFRFSTVLTAINDDGHEGDKGNSSSWSDRHGEDVSETKMTMEEAETRVSMMERRASPVTSPASSVKHRRWVMLYLIYYALSV